MRPLRIVRPPGRGVRGVLAPALCVEMETRSDIEFQYDGRLGEFNGMSSHSHVSHCRVLPLGEFTVTIPEPHATLQGAVP